MASRSSTIAPRAAALGFTGEQADPNGLIYLRARYHEPAPGLRSLAATRWRASLSRVMSRNGYSYVEGNPVNYVDPSGEFPFFAVALFLLSATVSTGAVIGAYDVFVTQSRGLISDIDLSQGQMGLSSLCLGSCRGQLEPSWPCLCWRRQAPASRSVSQVWLA